MMKRKQQQIISPDSDSGFTIIESLIAIVVVAILMAAIAPVLVMSTAIRVQARRVELSTQAVKTFIDGVRSGSIAKPLTVQLSTPTTASPRNISTRPEDYLLDTTKMPALSSSSATDLYCYKQDGKIGTPSGATSDTDCSNNQFYIQARKVLQTTGNNDGFRMAIRVYRADIDFSRTVKINTGASTKQTASSVTSGMGDKQAPLVEMTTDIANSSTSFQALCQRLGTPLITPAPTGTPASTPSPTPVPCG